MSSVDTKALRAARAAGTPGEWVRGRRPWEVPEGVDLLEPEPWEVFSQENVLGCCEVLASEREADAELAVTAVNAIDPACDELERLRARVAELEANRAATRAIVARWVEPLRQLADDIHAGDAVWSGRSSVARGASHAMAAVAGVKGGDDV